MPLSIAIWWPVLAAQQGGRRSGNVGPWSPEAHALGVAGRSALTKVITNACGSPRTEHHEGPPGAALNFAIFGPTQPGQMGRTTPLSGKCLAVKRFVGSSPIASTKCDLRFSFLIASASGRRSAILQTLCKHALRSRVCGPHGRHPTSDVRYGTSCAPSRRSGAPLYPLGIGKYRSPLPWRPAERSSRRGCTRLLGATAASPVLCVGQAHPVVQCPARGVAARYLGIDLDP